MKDMDFRYRSRDGRMLIELELNDLRQLFNTFDPAPFYEKDLDADAEEYIVGAVRELSPKQPMALVLYLPPHKVPRETPSMVADAIHNYFSYRTRTTTRDLRLLFRQGRASLVIGLFFLFLCIAIRSLFGAMDESRYMVGILKEGLLISGWVAMWRPIQMFLYDWWPIRRTIQVYRRLREIDIEIRGSPLAPL